MILSNRQQRDLNTYRKLVHIWRNWKGILDKPDNSEKVVEFATKREEISRKAVLLWRDRHLKELESQMDIDSYVWGE